MLSIHGVYKDGVVHPTHPLRARNGQRVIITFLEEENEELPQDDARELLRRVLANAGRLSSLSEGLREKIIPGVTLQEVQTALSRDAEKPLSTLILEQRERYS